MLRAQGCDVAISGHSHKPSTEDAGSAVWLNPRRSRPHRFRLPITLAFRWEEAGRPRAMIHPPARLTFFRLDMLPHAGC